MSHMNLITWNIQWGLGLDGRVDLARIVKSARSMADFDVLCVQEVADNFPGLEGNDDADQFAQLAALLPGFTRVEAYGVDVEASGGRRSRFGNAIYTRLPVLAVRRHALPWPPDPGKPSMPRAVAEATIGTPFGPVRLSTTHLEYFSALQRGAQVRRLRALHDEACLRAALPEEAHAKANASFKPAPQPSAAILAGDFNMPLEDPSYEEIRRPLDGGGPAYRDAWTTVHGNRPHEPTFCVHDDRYSKHPYCCDFIFVSADLAARARRVVVDGATRDSDHQPVLLQLDAS